MPGSTTSSSRAHLERGGISWVSALLLLVLVGGGYLGVVWTPVWFLHLDVKQRVRDYMNQAIKNTNDVQLVDKMCTKLASLETQEALDENGDVVKQPVVQVAPADVTWERDPSADPPTLHVQFSYTRDVHYPIIDRWTQVTLDVDLENDLTHANWGSSN